MRGSIRILVGLLATYVGVGTLDASIDGMGMLVGAAVSCVGLALMYSGVMASKAR